MTVSMTVRILNVDDLFLLNDLYTKLPAAWKIKRICRGRDDILNDTVDLSNINFIINKTVYSFESVSSKMLYNIFIAIIQDTFAFKHPEVIALNLDKSETTTCFSIPRFSTLDGKLREFQYKLLHNIIFCNDKLYLFGLTQSNLCSFCRKEVETYRHIFFECSEGTRIWNEMGNSLKMFQFLNMQWIDVLLGFRKNMKDNILLNHVLIMVKYMIYSNRKNGKFPTSKEICKAVENSKKVEHEKAKLKDKLPIHYQKWEKFTP